MDTNSFTNKTIKQSVEIIRENNKVIIRTPVMSLELDEEPDILLSIDNFINLIIILTSIYFRIGRIKTEELIKTMGVKIKI